MGTPMTVDVEDTVAAIATAPGNAARGIVRVSGREALACVARCCSPGTRAQLEHSEVSHRFPAIVQTAPPISEVPVDLFVWPTERSFSRQPTVEIHAIGSAPLLGAILRAVCDAGARLARPGEFTLRSFLAGRLDLAQAEAVLGVIDAANQAELRVALEQAAGGLSGVIEGLRQRLLELLAHLEAGMDFVDEDIQFIEQEHLQSELTSIRTQLTDLEIRFRDRGQGAGTPRVVLRGAPNVGKSSLFNALADGGKALVSDASGTTRDYLVQQIESEGVMFQLIDTAGVEEAVQDPLVVSVQTAMQTQWSSAHLELFCLDATREPSEWERSQLSATSLIPRMVVWTKADLTLPVGVRPDAVVTSSQTGLGLGSLKSAVAERLNQANSVRGEVVSCTAARCRGSLRGATQRISAALPWVAAAAGEELIAVEVRAALDEIGQIVGAVYTDDILDQIFSRFCIGK